jgi:glycosyltransferase involved in cell wall biosynthesis
VKLLTVTHFFPAHGGGMELVAARLVEEFAARGMSVSWFSSGTDPAPQLRAQQVELVSVPTTNFIEKLTQLPYPLWSPGSLPSLWRAIGAADVVHVHEHLYASSIATLVLAWLRRKPIVITQHMGALGLRNLALTVTYELGAKLLGYLLFPIAARAVFISDNVRRFFRLERSQRSTLIFNGIDTARFRATSPESRSKLRAAIGIPEDCRTVLFVGRFVRKKGLHIIAALARRFPNVLWILIGSGPDRPRVDGLANVRVPGRVEHDRLADYYHAADLLLLPSSGEGFPLVVQEALACGLGVLSTQEVATACPPVTELIRVRPTPRTEDDIEGWCDGLSAVISDESYLQARDARSDRVAGMWSWQQCANQYVQLFDGLVDGLAVRS